MQEGDSVLFRKEKIKNAMRYVYAAMMCILLLEFLLEMAFFDESERMSPFVWAARCVAGFLGIWLSKNWKKATFQLLAVFSSLILLRALIRQGNGFLEYKVIVKAMLYFIWVWGGCFSFGAVLQKDKIKAFLIVFGAVWTIGMTVCALYGLNAAWMQVRIPNLSGKGFFRLWGEADQARLKLVYLSTISGQLMAMSIIIAFICMLCVQKKGLKCLFCLSVFPMLIALTLTDSRNAQICVTAGVSVLAGIVILDREQKRIPESTGLRPKRVWIVSLAGMAATFVFSLLLLQIINPAFHQLKKSSVYWPFLQSGVNNTEKQIVFSNRGYLYDDLMTGRTDIWRATLTFLIGNPKYLLVGKSIINPMEAVNSQECLSFSAGHCHNIFLQTLLETGVPGLLILCAAIFKAGKYAVRTSVNKEAPLWQRAFLALIAVIGIGELAECLTGLYFPYLPFLSFLCIAAGCAVGNQEAENRALNHWLYHLFAAGFAWARDALPRAVGKMKLLFFIAVLVIAFYPMNDGAIYSASVIHQDDFDDPEKDLYYLCGDSQCETHQGRHTVKTSGCGLCAIVNAITYMTGEKIDVHEVAAFARENEHYAVHVGSKMTLYQAFAEEYGNQYNFSYLARVETLEEATDYLKQGCVAIAGAGNSGGGGHLLVLASYNPVTKQYLILDSAGNYSGWSHAFYSWQTIANNRLEKNPNVFLTAFQIYFSPLSPYRDI